MKLNGDFVIGLKIMKYLYAKINVCMMYVNVYQHRGEAVSTRVLDSIENGFLEV